MSEAVREMTYEEQITNVIINILAIETPFGVNADKIRSMTDEELAAFLADHPVVSEFDASKSLHMDWLLWLSLEVRE